MMSYGFACREIPGARAPLANCQAKEASSIILTVHARIFPCTVLSCHFPAGRHVPRDRRQDPTISKCFTE